MSTTRSQINSLIAQISDGGNYTAAELRTLESALLENIFGPFYDNANRNPTTSQNQSLGYKQNSLGVNRSTGRYFACSLSSDTAATWEQISLDKGLQSIVSSVQSQTYTISANTSILLFSGIQILTTINLPLATNSYAGKTIKVYFTPPAFSNASTSNGITFVCPETAGSYTIQVNGLNNNYYRSNSSIEFVFDGTSSQWVVSQYNATPQDIDIQNVSVTNGGNASLLKETSIARLTAGLVTSITSFTIRLPQDPYLNKVVDIIAPPVGSGSLKYIFSLIIQKSDGTAVQTLSIAAGQKLTYYFDGTTWSNIGQNTPINTAVQIETAVTSGTKTVEYNTAYLRLTSSAAVTGYTITLPQLVFDGRVVTIHNANGSDSIGFTVNDYGGTGVLITTLLAGTKREFMYIAGAFNSWTVLP